MTRTVWGRKQSVRRFSGWPSFESQLGNLSHGLGLATSVWVQVASAGWLQSVAEHATHRPVPAGAFPSCPGTGAPSLDLVPLIDPGTWRVKGTGFWRTPEPSTQSGKFSDVTVRERGLLASISLVPSGPDVTLCLWRPLPECSGLPPFPQPLLVAGPGPRGICAKGPTSLKRPSHRDLFKAQSAPSSLT